MKQIYSDPYVNRLIDYSDPYVNRLIDPVSLDDLQRNIKTWYQVEYYIDKFGGQLDLTQEEYLFGVYSSSPQLLHLKQNFHHSKNDLYKNYLKKKSTKFSEISRLQRHIKALTNSNNSSNIASDMIELYINRFITQLNLQDVIILTDHFSSKSDYIIDFYFSKTLIGSNVFSKNLTNLSEQNSKKFIESYLKHNIKALGFTSVQSISNTYSGTMNLTKYLLTWISESVERNTCTTSQALELLTFIKDDNSKKTFIDTFLNNKSYAIAFNDFTIILNNYPNNSEHTKHFLQWLKSTQGELCTRDDLMVLVTFTGIDTVKIVCSFMENTIEGQKSDIDFYLSNSKKLGLNSQKAIIEKFVAVHQYTTTHTDIIKITDFLIKTNSDYCAGIICEWLSTTAGKQVSIDNFNQLLKVEYNWNSAQTLKILTTFMNKTTAVQSVNFSMYESFVGTLDANHKTTFLNSYLNKHIKSIDFDNLSAALNSYPANSDLTDFICSWLGTEKGMRCEVEQLSYFLNLAKLPAQNFKVLEKFLNTTTGQSQNMWFYNDYIHANYKIQFVDAYLNQRIKDISYNELHKILSDNSTNPKNSEHVCNWLKGNAGKNYAEDKLNILIGYGTNSQQKTEILIAFLNTKIGSSENFEYYKPYMTGLAFGYQKLFMDTYLEKHVSGLKFDELTNVLSNYQAEKISSIAEHICKWINTNQPNIIQNELEQLLKLIVEGTDQKSSKSNILCAFLTNTTLGKTSDISFYEKYFKELDDKSQQKFIDAYFNQRIIGMNFETLTAILRKNSSNPNISKHICNWLPSNTESKACTIDQLTKLLGYAKTGAHKADILIQFLEKTDLGNDKNYLKYQDQVLKIDDASKKRFIDAYYKKHIANLDITMFKVSLENYPEDKSTHIGKWLATTNGQNSTQIDLNALLIYATNDQQKANILLAFMKHTVVGKASSIKFYKDYYYTLANTQRDAVIKAYRAQNLNIMKFDDLLESFDEQTSEDGKVKSITDWFKTKIGKETCTTSNINQCLIIAKTDANKLLILKSFISNCDNGKNSKPNFITNNLNHLGDEASKAEFTQYWLQNSTQGKHIRAAYVKDTQRDFTIAASLITAASTLLITAVAVTAAVLFFGTGFLLAPIAIGAAAVVVSLGIAACVSYVLYQNCDIIRDEKALKIDLGKYATKLRLDKAAEAPITGATAPALEVNDTIKPGLRLYDPSFVSAQQQQQL